MFGDRMKTCNWKGSRICLLVVIVAVCSGFLTGNHAIAQNDSASGTKAPASKSSTAKTPSGKTQGAKNSTNKIAQGKITGIERQGKTLIIKWQEPKFEGFPEPPELVLQYTPKTSVLVKAPGTTSLLNQGVMIGAVLTEKENQLSGHEFVLFLDTRQSPSVVQDPDRPDFFKAVGQLEGIAGTQLIINYGEAGTKQILVDYEPTVTVHAVNPLFLTVGAEGKVDYVPNKVEGKPALLAAIEVSREEAFSEDELKGKNIAIGKTSEKSPASKKPTTAKTSKPVQKSSTPAGSKAPVKDPFGVLDK